MTADNRLVPLAMMMPGEGGVIREMRGVRHHLDGHIRAKRHRRPPRGHRDPHLKTCDRGHRLEHRLNHLGLLPGEQLRVVRNSAPGPMIIAVKGSRLCISRGVAFHLMVEPDRECSP